MEITTRLATNVRKYRKAAGLSQEKLAEKAGMHRTYIGGIEQQRVNASLKNIGRIAEALDIDPTLLLEDNTQSDNLAALEKTGNPIGLDRQSRRRSQHSETPPTAKAALVIWDDDGNMEFLSIEEAYGDLIIHVLTSLIKHGYSGKALIERYQAVIEEIKNIMD